MSKRKGKTKEDDSAMEVEADDASVSTVSAEETNNNDDDDQSNSTTESTDDDNDEDDDNKDVKDSLGKLAKQTPKKKAASKKKAAKGKEDSKGSDKDDEVEKNGNEEKPAEKKRNRKSAGTAGALNKTYIQICHEAIVDMKDRTGSSLAAIKKWILTKYPDLGGPQFNTRVNQGLKNGLKAKRFEKIKASFKISKNFKEAERAKKKRKAAALAKSKKVSAAKIAAKAAEKKKKEREEKKKKEMEEKKKRMSEEEKAKLAKEQAARAEAARRRAIAEAKAKAIADRIRKRRYPIEDTKLHAEDKELGVKPPADVGSRPYIPYFWYLTYPLSDKARTGKTNSAVLNNSKVDGLDFGSRGLVPDLLQVYHFFRGDVHFTLSPNSAPIVPDFTLQNLVYATEKIVKGQAKKAKILPPLITHLFVTALQILFQKPPDKDDDTVHVLSKNERQLRNDCHNYLLPSLTPASWSDVCFMYMDAMDRYYCHDTSRDPNVLQPLPIDAEYLLGVKDDMIIPETPLSKHKLVKDEEDDGEKGGPVVSHPLPEYYSGYLGDNRSALYKAHIKLGKQDPWHMTAEEIFALLRALTDDILATHPSAAIDIASREEQMYELLKAKRAADAKFRKVRVAFEGPKNPKRKSTGAKENNNNGEEKKTEEDKDKENGKIEGDDNENENDDKKPFKPTVSKKQFENAKKAQQKASDAYEKGIRSLVARTEPVGHDRFFNAVYCFRHDPEILYVEDRRPPSGIASHLPDEIQIPRFSWHVIESTSLFDLFTQSLDIRGKREHDLCEELVGPPGSQQSLRKYLHDDIKEQQLARAKLKEKEALYERLKAAKIKCDEEQGRRSGRLAGHAENELIAIQEEVDALEREAEGNVESPPRDYSELTGMEILKQYETGGKMETRRTREKKAASKTRDLPLMPCSKLCATGNIDGTGLVGMIVSDLLELEEFCESLVPWEKGEEHRNNWIGRLEEAVVAWNSISSDLLSDDEEAAGDDGSIFTSKSGARVSLDESVNSKRRKVDSIGSTTHSVSSVITLLKQPLLELEHRIADATNAAAATKDADLADDNMSAQDVDDQGNKDRLERAWKRCVHKVRETPTKKCFHIREHLVAAISAARKAHLPEVVTKLRGALLLYHPNAASECKVAAIKILEEYGDYEEDDDDESVDDQEEKEEPKEEPAPSVLSAEAVMLSSCLGGADDATRFDWISLVKSVKTMSRLAALTAAFTHDANEKLAKLEVERDALTDALKMWEKEEERVEKLIEAGRRATRKELDGPSEVWADVRFTDKFCMAKAEHFPWWPAKQCEPRDPNVAASLKKLNRCLVALVGEMGGLRVVKLDQIREFTGKRIDDDADLAEHTKDMRTQLDDCLAMARRILRGLGNRKRKK